MRVVGDWFRVTWLREAQLCTLNINKKEKIWKVLDFRSWMYIRKLKN